MAQIVDGGLLFALTDSAVTLDRPRVRLQTLPRQATAQEIHQHVAERLEVISSTLLCDNQSSSSVNEQ